MGCRVHARLEIGGRVTKEQFERILDELGAGAGDDELTLEPAAGPPGGWRFAFDDPETNYGIFSVEHYLAQEEISFNRYHEGSGAEFSAGVAFYRPALGRTVEFSTDGAEPVLSFSQVRALIAQTQTREGLIAELKEALGEGIPELPALELDFDPFAGLAATRRVLR